MLPFATRPKQSFVVCCCCFCCFCLFVSKTTLAWVAVLPHSRSRSSSSRLHHLSLSSSRSNSNNNNENKDSAMLDFMENQASMFTKATTTDATDRTQLDDDILQLVYAICRAADDRKADNIVALDVKDCTTLCSVLVLCSGNSRPQNQAIVKSIQDSVQEFYQTQEQEHAQARKQILPEGTADSGWMILDYGSVMVHVMTPKSRLYYNVEGQWVEKASGDGDERRCYLNLDPVLQPQQPQVSSSNNDDDADETTDLQQSKEQQEWNVPQDQDPFWS